MALTRATKEPRLLRGARGRVTKAVAAAALALSVVLVAAGATAPPAQAIVYGSDVANADLSGQVQIWKDKPTALGLAADYVCTGTAISSFWVLTAKHCFDVFDADAATYRVRAGGTQFGAGLPKAIERIVRNPTSDTALIRVRGGVPFTFRGDGAPRYGTDLAPLGTPIKVVGWGTTREGPTPQSPAVAQSGEMTVGLQSRLSQPNQTPPTPRQDFIDLYSRQGRPSYGDSGAGAFITSRSDGFPTSNNPITNGLLCGVYVSTNYKDPAGIYLSDDGIGWAVSTRSITPWIIATTGIIPDPFRTCRGPVATMDELTETFRRFGEAEKIGQDLRVMPLGDSLTQGYQSSNGNGYRNAVFQAMDPLAGDFDLVGTAPPSGTMSDPQNEGHPGWDISKIAGITSEAMKKCKPNVVTLLAGTNDLNGNEDVARAPQRLAALVDQILGTDPAVEVLVAKIPASSDSALQGRITAYNDAITPLMESRDRVTLVETGNITTADMFDALHPNDRGYDKLGRDFTLNLDGLFFGHRIHKPAPLPPGCSGGGSGSGTGNLPVGVPNFQQGATVADAPSGPGSNQPGSSPLPGGGYVLMADMDGDGKADYVQVGADNSLTVWLNREKDGKITWSPQGKIRDGVTGGRVLMADLDGNRLKDYVHLDPGGDVSVYLNNGHDSSQPGGWKWTRYSVQLHAEQPNGKPGIDGKIVDHYEFADLDNDLLDDFITVYTDSSFSVDTNGSGIHPASANFERGWGFSRKTAGYLAAPGIGVPGSMIRFADINGNGKADYMVVDATTGAMSAYLATTTQKDADTGALTYNFKGAGLIASGVGPGAQVRLADMDGDGKADYVFVTGRPDAGTWYHNGGPNAKSPSGWVFDPRGNLATSAGEQTVFADMNGDGKADIVRIGSNSSLTAQLASGGGFTPTFGSSVALAPGIGVDGSQIRLADIDGDGKADYLNVDPKTGAVTAFFNQGPSGAGGGYSFSAPVQIAGGVAPGAQIRFADMRGIGRADYVVVNPTTGGLDDYENCGYDKATQKQCWIPHTKIAGGLAPGDQIRLAPVFGTGRADYLIVHPNGSVDAYVNGGPGNATGGGWLWIQQNKPIAGGVGAPGEQIQFADLNGNKFADYLIVRPDGSVVDWANAGLVPAT